MSEFDNVIVVRASAERAELKLNRALAALPPETAKEIL